MDSGLTRILSLLVTFVMGGMCWAETTPTMLELQAGLARVENVFDTQVNGWRAYGGDPSGAETSEFDDSAWDVVDVGHAWPAESICWLRRWIEVPQKVAGLPAEGAGLSIRFKMDNPARIYVNGALKQEIDWYGKGNIVLTEAAKLGDRFLVAVRAEGGGHIGFRPWPGTLENAQLETPAGAEVLPRIETLLEKMRFAMGLVETGTSRSEWQRALGQTLDALERAGKNALLDNLGRAESVFEEKVFGVIQRATEERLIAVAPQIDALRDLIESGEAAGVDLSYPRVTLTVAENFSRYALEDVASHDFE
ncbi:MAG: hypothetical protein GY851_18765, partial [bacterium]|nr:hypothetical protein [bacterium]